MLETVEKTIDIDKFSLRTNRLSIRNRREAERKAQFLVEKFERLGSEDAMTSYWFFVKCFQRLSEDAIWSLFERVTNDSGIKSPIKYFIKSCCNLM